MLHALSALLIATQAPTPVVTAGSTCTELYANTTMLKPVFGDPRDERLAPAVDEWLTAYVKDYRDKPSYETYLDRLRAHGFDGDSRAAYDFMQSFSADRSVAQFKQLLKVIAATEKLAGPLEGYPDPIDPSALRYTRCLREHIATRLRALPDTTYYTFGRDRILSAIEGGPSIPR